MRVLCLHVLKCIPNIRWTEGYITKRWSSPEIIPELVNIHVILIQTEPTFVANVFSPRSLKINVNSVWVSKQSNFRSWSKQYLKFISISLEFPTFFVSFFVPFFILFVCCCFCCFWGRGDQVCCFLNCFLPLSLFQETKNTKPRFLLNILFDKKLASSHVRDFTWKKMKQKSPNKFQKVSAISNI